MNKFTGVILAGGKSSRLGRDKSELLFKGSSFLHHCQKLLDNAGATNIIISSNDKYGIPDVYPDCGPLSGIHASLQQAQNDLLIIPVDMPLLTCELLTGLVKNKRGTSEAAHYEYYPLPLYLSNTQKVRNILSTILMRKENLSIRALISQLEHETLPVTDSRLFSNVNTIEDYKSIVTLSR